ncbi:DUF1592 domain-containing protein [Thalassoroseus pseudoceratinae]|uniref:DUF1592 domain-containing protein n=1 Tax=Thalassoroseus pseudoceratinae TaxID=2713176 RepID=UPI00141E4123|nr:DUF1592 domain-containing protein [Thalassoroseus pseudoceratinae]
MESARIMRLLMLIVGLSPCVTNAAGIDGEATRFVSKYCVDCHTGEDAHGQIDLQAMSQGDVGKYFRAWEAVAERLHSREMPPEDHPQPTEAERLKFLDWYEHTLVKSVKPQPALLRPRRLCAVEYRNTMRSLFGFDLEVAIIEAEQTVVEKSLVMKLLPTDPPGRSGFCNDTHAAPLTTVLWDQYSYLSDTAIAELFSPKRRDVLEAVVGPVSTDGITKDQADRLIRSFADRAFRRPIEDAKFREFTLFSDNDNLESATKSVLKRIVMSPQFLYRGFGVDREQTGRQQVDSYEFAERLSYFIWADMPDDELFTAAASNQLSTPEQIRQQIDRMIDSPKSITLATDFAYQWLTLGEVEKNNVQVPQAEALRSQPRDFMHYLFVDARPLIELIDSRTTFANPYTRRFYGADSNQLPRYRKASGIEREIVANQKITLVETEHRGGILTMPGILAMNRGPILRGIWVLERILGEHLPEPPPDVGQVPPAPQGKELSFRQRFEQHRNKSACAVCHDRIDPLGFAFERYTGANYQSQLDVDTSGRLPSGEEFDDFQGLKQILVTSQRQRVIRNIVERTLSYALCRKLELFDRPTVDALTEKLHRSNGTYRDLVFEIAMSLPFRETIIENRPPQQQESKQ